MSNASLRTRPKASEGNYSKLHGEYRASFMSGAVTLAAAETTTAGHMFVMRVPTAETKKAIIRYVGCEFATVTAAGAQQPMGYSLIVARAFTVAYTGGTAIDMFTITGSQKVRTDQATTLFTANNVRMCTTAGLTAGTQTLDSQAYSRKMFLSPVLGEVARVDLLDARDDGVNSVRSPIELAADEGIVVRNTILMGATLVGNLIINVEWDEVTL
jgi:hypothetical protein